MTDGRYLRNRKKKPSVSAAYWLGYVDEGETVEMIEKKFEKLAQLENETKQNRSLLGTDIRHQVSSQGTDYREFHKVNHGENSNGSSTNMDMESIQGKKLDSELHSRDETKDSPHHISTIDHVEKESLLDERMMIHLFQETSTFSVGMVSEQSEFNNGMLSFDPDLDDPSTLFSDNEDQFFGSADSFWDSEYDSDNNENRKRKRLKTLKECGSERVRSKIIEVTTEEGYVYTIKKKVRIVDPLMPVFTRIPPEPIPLSWAKNIANYEQLEGTASIVGSKHIETDVVTFDFRTLIAKDVSEIGGKSMLPIHFQAILMDPPWDVLWEGEPKKGLVNTKIMERMNLHGIIPRGFLFIWVEKQLIPQTVKLMESWDFTYVENLVWVKQTPNNQIAKQDYKYFCRSKTSLLIFKKGDGLELRHQRNPDVVFDFIRDDKGLSEDKPEFVYTVIETLLPNARFDEKTGIKLLELWSKRGKRRSGWVTIAQKL